jgi:putative transposase
MHALRGLPRRLLRMAPPRRERPEGAGPALAEHDSGAVRQQSPHVWQPADPSSSAGCRHAGQPPARGPAHARGRAARPGGEALPADPRPAWVFHQHPNHQLDRWATGPDQVWVGDITYLKVGPAWRYLAVVLDRYSRRVIGWSLGPTKDARLTLAAFNRAVGHRRPRPGVIFHSDRGVEYAAYAFRDRLARLGFVQSMNRPREITDTAHMESFFHSMKSDVVHGIRFAQEAELRTLLCSYIPYYNRVRLHSGIGYSSPIAYETHT